MSRLERRGRRPWPRSGRGVKLRRQHITYSNDTSTDPSPTDRAGDITGSISPKRLHQRARSALCTPQADVWRAISRRRARTERQEVQLDRPSGVALARRSLEDSGEPGEASDEVGACPPAPNSECVPGAN